MKWANTKIKDFLVNKRFDEDFGVEIEMETYFEAYQYEEETGLYRSYPKNKTLDQLFKVTTDGSLKENGVEWIFQRPMNKPEALNSIDRLKDHLSKSGNHILKSVRAGIHIHINVCELTPLQIYNFMAIWLSLETCLMRKAGDNREGNLFCLRSSDAGGLPLALEKSVKQGLKALGNDNLRYSSLNPNPLFTFGSLEFRGLGTTPELDNIELWMDVLYRIRKVAMEMGTPEKIPDIVSGMGGSYWMREVLGDKLADNFLTQDTDKEIFESVRNIQMFIYELSYQLKQPIKDEPKNPTTRKEYVFAKYVYGGGMFAPDLPLEWAVVDEA